MSILIQDLDHSAAMAGRITGESKTTSCAFTIEFLVTPLVKNPLVNAGDERDAGLILGLEDPLEDGNPLQYFFPGKCHVAWWATVHGVARSQT